MKNVLRGAIVIFLLSIGYELYSTQKKLRFLIKEKNKQINDILLEKNINDSLCKDILHTLPLGSPLKFIIINSKFGLRKDPFSRRYRKHYGLDLKGTKKDTVFSTGGGYIECADHFGGYGKCVIINHGQGYKTFYGHLSKIFVKENNFISDKKPIGLVGNTGRSKGTHLHYEIQYNGMPINPQNLIYLDF